MNQSAERHLAKARDYIAKGEGWYRKAATEIRAAKNEGATWPEIGTSLGRSKSWAEKVVAWAESPANGASAPTPFAEPGRDNPDLRGAKRILREAPLEQIEQLVAGLPKGRQQAIAAAAGNRYAQARQEHDEAERDLTPAQRKEREAQRAQTQEMSSKMISGFATLGIVGHIEQATEEMAELNADHAISEELLGQIEEAVKALVTELDVARAMLGLEGSEIR